MKYARVPLKAVVSYNDEVLPERINEDQLIRYIEIGDVREAEGIRGAAETTFGEAPSRARRILREGDVIVSTVRTYLRAVAPVTAQDAGSIASTGFAVLRARRVEPRFLRYAVLNREFLDEVVARSVGTSYPAINASDLVRVHIPLPPEQEQLAIADYLDRETAQIDAFLAKNEELIALLRERRTAAVTKAVTAGLRSATLAIPTHSPELGGIPQHWDVLQLRHLLVSIDQGVSPQADANLATDGQWGVLKSGCVNGGMFRPEEHKALPADYPIDPAIVVRPGDLLVNRASGSVSLLGSAGIVSPSPYRLILSDKTFRLRLNSRVHAEYLYWWLNSRSYREQIAAWVSGADGLANNLPMSTLRGFVMPLPASIEQAEIVGHLRAVTASADRAIEAVRRAISLARERRAALISAAVTGKIDVGVKA